jgi:hypothetical protein
MSEEIWKRYFAKREGSRASIVFNNEIADSIAALPLPLVLYPLAEDWQMIRDMAVAKSLEADGDDASKIHAIDHFTYFKDETEAREFADWACEEGYRDVSVEPPEPPNRAEWLVQIHHDGKTTLFALTDHSVALSRKARELGGEYDGWGTFVIKSEDSPPEASDPLPSEPRNNLLPLALSPAYLAHIAEEWWGGFVPWLQHYGPVTAAKFLILNAIIWSFLTAAVILASRSARFGFVALVASAALGLNGIVHLVASVVTASYSPGAVTGALLYIPLAAAIWRNASHWSERRLHLPAIAAAFLLHGLVVAMVYLVPS